jgi:F0F1-type ATP synthase membrane subunit c/vacuolar-type H+-ATPase subunit K
VKGLRALGLVFELAMLAAGILTAIAQDGPVADGLRTLALVVAGMVGAVVVFVAVVFAIGLLDQLRQPPLD